MKTYSVLVSIANYAALALVDIGFLALIPLFYATPIEIGGLGLPPSVIGVCLAIWGLCNGVFQILLVGKSINRFGEKNLFRIAVLGYIPLIVTFPIMSLIVQSQRKVGPVVWPLMLAQLVFALIGDSAYCTPIFSQCKGTDCFNPLSAVINVIVIKAAPNRHTVGTMNGLCQTTTSIARAIGPVAFSSLFAFSKECNILGGNLVYLLILTLISLLVFLSSLLPDLQRDEDMQ